MFLDDQKTQPDISFKIRGQDFQTLSQAFGWDFEVFRVKQKLCSVFKKLSHMFEIMTWLSYVFFKQTQFFFSPTFFFMSFFCVHESNCQMLLTWEMPMQICYSKNSNITCKQVHERCKRSNKHILKRHFRKNKIFCFLFSDILFPASGSKDVTEIIGKNTSYHFTSILFMNGSHLCRIG